MVQCVGHPSHRSGVCPVHYELYKLYKLYELYKLYKLYKLYELSLGGFAFGDESWILAGPAGRAG